MNKFEFDPMAELDKLCELITRCRAKGVTYRYTPEVKNKVIELKEKGVSVPLICARSGINMKSVYLWSKKDKPKSNKKFKSLSVESTSGIEVKLPNGTTIQGLSSDDLKEMFSHALSK